MMRHLKEVSYRLAFIHKAKHQWYESNTVRSYRKDTLRVRAWGLKPKLAQSEHV